MIARLQAAPYRFQFMQALRVMLIWLRREGVPPDRALRHVLRFRNSLSLTFPASEIESLSIDLAADTPKPATVTRIQLTPAFFGLLGANGTLPLHYTEWIAAHEYAERDESIRACLDMFSDRSIGLFFRAWTKYRPEHAMDVLGEDPYRPLLLSLGVRPVPQPKTDDLAPHADAMVFYLGLLRQRPMSAAALSCILPDYFGVPIAIEQFVGGWDDIADNRQCRMGGENATLGHSGALGVRAWRHDLGVRLHIGPLCKADFERFLPGTAGARTLESLLTLVGIPGLRYTAHVMLRPEDVAPLDLVGGAKPGKRIGFDARLGLSGKTADVRYLLQPS
ncbi:type VI secretion system baseplate subunit TssG [Massilia sp.]|uniref:type VI secretion system baseplate subunit TssG n=1 Tax=Massilia sp. TaxID=1882437 RepID=UPI00352D31F1